MTIEKLGKPGVFIAYSTFFDDAKRAAEDNGMPTVRIVKVPSSKWYSARATVEKIRPHVEDVFDEIVRALLEPLTEEERRPGRSFEGGLERLRIEGESLGAVLEKFNDLFLENKWGDGLPLLPPTEERFKWMMKGTSRSAEEVLGTIAPREGVATVGKVAINAVMAGAKPEYLPVIITAMEILADKDFDDRHVLQSAGGFSLMIVVTGPIAHELGINSGIGFLGHGWRSNNTIGRAVRLSTLNIGHSWPAVNDMAITGRPSAHTFYVFAENNRESPWPPYHTIVGFDKEASCVTVFTFGTYYGVGGLSGYGGGIMTFSGDEILERIVQDIRNDRRFLLEWNPGGMMPGEPGHGKGPRKHMIVLFPAAAKELAHRFPSQRALAEEIYERTRIPFEELTAQEREAIKAGLEGGVVPSDRKEVFEEALRPGGRVPVLVSPEDVHVFVAGGAPGFAFGASYYRLPPYNNTAIMTKAIRGAALTEAGR